MDVSIIIVNYNTKKMTLECINSIYEKTEGVSFEIILIDNGSTDGSKELFENDNRIKYVYSYENMGFGRANNVGMMLANGDFFFLLNSDTLLINNAVKIFYEQAIKLQQKAFLGCWLVDSNDLPTHSGGDIQTIKSILWELCKSYIPGRHEGDRAIQKSTDALYKIGYVTGADMFFHRSLYEQTHGFDCHYFMYSEELDWQRTTSKQGIYSFIINGPKIIHLEGGSQLTDKKDLNIDRFERFTRSRFYYIRKNCFLPKYVLFRVSYFILYAPKLLCKSSNFKTILKAFYFLIKL